MDFLRLPLDEAIGTILAHNVAGEGGRRILRKGRALTEDNIETLRALGRRTVYVARLAPDDVDENAAARRIAEAASGGPLAGLRRSKETTGRVNLYAETRGVLRVDTAKLRALNSLDGITLSTLPQNTAVRQGKMVATLKIIPYAVPETRVREAEVVAGPSLLTLDPLVLKRIGLVLTGSPAARDRVVDGFEGSLGPRLEALGASIDRTDFVPVDEDHEEDRLAEVLSEHLDADRDLIIVAGDTAIMDRHDITPRAVERAGAEIACFGVPVDPGNLLLIAYRDQTPIVGTPGCARSPKRNIIDLVLPRLLAGDRLTKEDLLDFGHGGLLEDVPERPLPRSRLG